jgi:hypothetical protein
MNTSTLLAHRGERATSKRRVLAEFYKSINIRERKNLTCDVRETADFEVDWRTRARSNDESKLLLVRKCIRLPKRSSLSRVIHWIVYSTPLNS